MLRPGRKGVPCSHQDLRLSRTSQKSDDVFAVGNHLLASVKNQKHGA